MVWMLSAEGPVVFTRSRRRWLIGIAITLIVVWVLAWLVFKIVGFAVHLLVIAAVIFLIAGLVRRGARRTGI
jgi:hypothetical protein